MVDGSELPYNKNVDLVKGVVKFAHAAGVAVEAELGHVGRAKDDLFIRDKREATMTNPNVAKNFSKLFSVTSFIRKMLYEMVVFTILI